MLVVRGGERISREDGGDDDDGGDDGEGDGDGGDGDGVVLCCTQRQKAGA